MILSVKAILATVALGAIVSAQAGELAQRSTDKLKGTLSSKKSFCNCTSELYAYGACRLPELRVDDINGLDRKYLVALGSAVAETRKGQHFSYSGLCGATIELSHNNNHIRAVVAGQAKNTHGVEMCEKNYKELLGGRDGDVSMEVISKPSNNMTDLPPDPDDIDYDCPTDYYNNPTFTTADIRVTNIDGTSRTMRRPPDEERTA